MTKQDIAKLQADANAYFMESEEVSFLIENRQEELEGILRAYSGMRDASAQVLRQYFLKGGVLHD